MKKIISQVKWYIRHIPYVMPTYKWVRSVVRPTPKYHFVRRVWGADAAVATQTEQKILNLLEYTKTSGSGYPGTEFPAGYHEITINGQTYAGQRRPNDRLDKVPYDFTGKTVLDIGCNQGGMIFALQDKIKWGAGVDYDYRMINACNSIKNELALPHTRFYTFDIDTDPHTLLQDFLPEARVDIVFLLAVCFWVRDWRPLIDYCLTISDTMLFEANGDDASITAQIAYLKTKYTTVTQLSTDSNEDTTCRTRQLLLATNV